MIKYTQRNPQVRGSLRRLLQYIGCFSVVYQMRHIIILTSSYFSSTRANRTKH